MSGAGFPSNPNQYAPLTVFNGLMPKGGPKVIPYVCNFPQQSSYLIDLTLTESQGYMTVVQSIYIDAIKATQPVTVSIQGTLFEITAPAGSQGFYPSLAPNNTKFVVTSSSTGPVTLMLLNVPVPANVWDVAGSGGSTNVNAAIVSPLAGNAPASGSTPALSSVAPGVSVWTDHSVTVTSTAGFTLLAAVAAGSRGTVIIQNGANAIWVNRLGGTAGAGLTGCFQIPANALYQTAPGESTWQAWNVQSSATGSYINCITTTGN